MIETKSLILKSGSADDWQELYRNLWSREEVFRYLFSSPCPTGEAAKKKTAAYAQMHGAVNTEFFVYEKASGQAIGIAGVKELSPHHWTVTDIAIGPDFQGKGYGRQIVNALAALAFENSASEIAYDCFRQNEASKRLALSCGFTYSHSGEAELLKNGEKVVLDYYLRTSGDDTITALIDRYTALLRQNGLHTKIEISHNINKKVEADENRILLNEERIPTEQWEACIACGVRQILLPKLVIQTERLILRPFLMSDSEDCFGFLQDREDCYNDGGYEPFSEMDDEYFALMEKFSTQPLRKMIVCRETGRVIGTVHIMEATDRAVEAYELGYCVSKAYQRKGYGYEAVKAVCDCLLSTLHTDLLAAGAIQKNTASLRLLQKLGFAFEGRRTKAFYHPADGPVDLLYYVLEREEKS